MPPGRPRYSFRSPLTLTLLILLRSQSLPTHILAYSLNLPSKYISWYLSRLKKLGLVYRDNFGLWSITDLGLSYLDSLERSLSMIDYLKDRVKQITSSQIIKLTTKIGKNTTKIGRKTKEIHSSNLLTKLFNNSASLESFIEKVEERMDRPLTEVEFRLVSFLWSFTVVTGRKYWWPPQPVSLVEALAEELRISSSIDALEMALRELESKGIIYITYDKRRGVPKIRLDRSLDNV